MSDRLQEIRARLDAATPGPWVPVLINGVESPGIRNPVPTWAQNDLIAHAPADIAWLLDEVERLRRLAACPDCDYVDGGKPCAYCAAAHNEPVAQGVTKQERGNARR